MSTDPEHTPDAITARPASDGRPDGGDGRCADDRHDEPTTAAEPWPDHIASTDVEPADEPRAAGEPRSGWSDDRPCPDDQTWDEYEQRDEDEQPVLLSRWARVVLAAVTVLIGAALAVHLTAMFLGAAPANTVSQRYEKQLAAWTEPWLEQNWKLFAPNPVSANVTMRARDRLVTGVAGPWIDLSAADEADTLHNPMPDHETQNQLRNAWFDYLDDVPASGEPNTIDGTLMRQQLCRVVLDRLDRLDSRLSGQVDAVMLQVTSTPVPAPGTPTSRAPRPSVQTLPWWPTATICADGGTR